MGREGDELPESVRARLVSFTEPLAEHLQKTYKNFLTTGGQLAYHLELEEEITKIKDAMLAKLDNYKIEIHTDELERLIRTIKTSNAICYIVNTHDPDDSLSAKLLINAIFTIMEMAKDNDIGTIASQTSEDEDLSLRHLMTFHKKELIDAAKKMIQTLPHTSQQPFNDRLSTLSAGDSPFPIGW